MREKIGNLQSQWGYLDGQAPTASQSDDPRLHAIAMEAQRLRDQASELSEQVRALALVASRPGN